MKKCYVLILGLVLPLMGMAQWSGRGEVRTFHCRGCVGVPDLELSPTAMAMQGVVKADIELCDSLGRTVDAWRQVPLGAEGDTAVAAAVYRFMLRRVGYAELLLYRPTEWDPRQMETSTYIIPTMKAESSRKKSLNFIIWD